MALCTKRYDKIVESIAEFYRVAILTEFQHGMFEERNSIHERIKKSRDRIYVEIAKGVTEADADKRLSVDGMLDINRMLQNMEIKFYDFISRVVIYSSRNEDRLTQFKFAAILHRSFDITENVCKRAKAITSTRKHHDLRKQIDHQAEVLRKTIASCVSEENPEKRLTQDEAQWLISFLTGWLYDLDMVIIYLREYGPNHLRLGTS